MIKPRALIFDWDNTLVDSFGTIHAALAETQRIMGTEIWTLQQAKERVRHSLRDTFPITFGQQRWEEARDIFYAAFEKLHLDHLIALPGAEETLRALSSHCLLAVVSNKTGRYLRSESKHLGWDGMFHRVVGATDCARDKPSPDPVLKALEESGINPGPDVWFVGDTDIDLECAHNSGCVAVLVRQTVPLPGEFGKAPPDFHVGEISQLKALALNQ
ncbi:MAG: HAD family hydrolase [Rhodospirillales bacterium]